MSDELAGGLVHVGAGGFGIAHKTAAIIWGILFLVNESVPQCLLGAGVDNVPADTEADLHFPLQVVELEALGNDQSRLA